MSNSHQQHQAHFIDKREIIKQPLLPRCIRVRAPQLCQNRPTEHGTERQFQEFQVPAEL